MKVNHPNARQQNTPPQEQATSAPLVSVPMEGPAGGVALQALADLSSFRRRARDDSARLRRSKSYSEGWPNSAPAPALHDIIGRQRVGELDARFGSLQPPLNLATDGIKDWEREGGTSLSPAEAMTGHGAWDSVDEPPPKRHRGDRDPEGSGAHPRKGFVRKGATTRSLSAGHLRREPTAPTLPFTELVGKARAEQLDREWGTLQRARVKNGKPQIHAWEEGLHPDRVVVPVGNPQNCDLKSMIDLEAIKAGTPMLWSVGMGAPLILGPFTLLPDPDPETGKEQRLGHPALVAGDKDPGSGEWVWGKQARISGELRWDESRKQFYIINQSGRYSRHLDRGMDQMVKVAQQFEKSGLAVEIRLVEKKS